LFEISNHWLVSDLRQPEIIKIRGYIPADKLFKLSILDLRIWVHLGCSDQEKFNPQLVSLDIELYFKSLPEGATSDKLEETVCYSQLVLNVKSFCQNRKFNLIEYLTAEIYKVVEESLNPHRSLIASIKVTGHKMSPPVPDIHGGVTFTYCDGLSSKKG